MNEITIQGQPYSKANSRRLMMKHGKPFFIKSKEALAYAKSFAKQVAALPTKPEIITEGEVRVEIHIWYKTQRPDLDESLILDLCQGVLYANDRQVREKHIYHSIDKENPRCLIKAHPRQ